MRSLRALLLTLLCLALTACGDDEERRSLPGGPGAAVFAEAGCGGCHTLGAAGSTGTTGPNLDELKPDRDRVARKVRSGGGGMPSFEGRLDDDEIGEVAAYVADAARGALAGKTVAGTFEPDETKLSDCGAGDFPCYEQAFANIAFSDGPKRALALFDQRISSDAAIEANCHRIAHAIGAAALARYEGRVGRALAEGSATCWSGYYHGTIERALVGVEDDELPQASRKLCADAELRSGSTFVLYQCVHGLGHGLMIYTGYNLPRSLRVCDSQTSSWDQTACTGGVFMENLQSSYGVKSKWLRDNDLIYPCNAVARRHKYYCYLMVTSRILQARSYDFAQTAELCRRSEPRWVRICFQSFGRDASGQTRQNPRKINELCRFAGGMGRECLYGAARDMTSNYAGGREAAVMCNLAPARHRAYCFEGIGTVLGTLATYARQRRAACRAITRRYAPACIRGARA